jgi:uracil-DNA glycosylase
MSNAFEQLFDATVRHLEDLKERGIRHVNVSPETLASLKQAAARPALPPRAPVRSVERPTGPESTLPASRPVPKVEPPSALPASPAPGAPDARPTFQAALGASPTPASISPPLAPADKARAMEELRARALACQRCPHLARARRNVVFGVGDINASLMFIGEAPGADEDRQGEPFVGAAGQLLTRIIQTMGLSRQTVYIANILKCRPDTPGQAAGNRPPTEEEMETCFPYLLEQIDLIQPRVIVALGATAVKGLLHNKIGITKLRGQWQTFRNVPTMPTYHPAYLLRNQALAEKRKVWEDMLQVMQKLGLPISDKQRGYFTKG